MNRPAATIEEQLAELRGLYQRDPDLFEQRRQALIRTVIEGFPPQSRARAFGLQFQLEATLRHYRHPVARMNKMVEIFWAQVEKFQQVLADPEQVSRSRDLAKEQGQVLEFRRRSDWH